MEKIKVCICGRDYSFLSDDSPERIIRIAKSLEKEIESTSRKLRNRSEQELLTLIALNVLDETDKQLSDMDRKIKKLQNEISIEKEKSASAFDENMKSAESELVQLASVKDEENEALRLKLVEYERNFENFVSDREKEISKLNEGFNSAIKEMEHIASVKEAENAKLRNALNSYETTFDLYAKTKEDEIIKLRQQIDGITAEADELRQRLAALSDDGQLTIC